MYQTENQIKNQMLQSTLCAILTTRLISIFLKYLITATTVENYESKKYCHKVLHVLMQEASDALVKLQTVTLFRPIRSLQCSW